MSDEAKTVQPELPNVSVEGQTNDAKVNSVFTKEDVEKILNERLKDFVPKKDYAGLQKKNQELAKSIMTEEERNKIKLQQFEAENRKLKLEKYGAKYNIPDVLYPAITEDDDEEIIENKFSAIQKSISMQAEKEIERMKAELLKQGNKAAKVSTADVKKELNVEDIKKEFEHIQKNLHRMSKEEKARAEARLKEIKGA